MAKRRIPGLAFAVVHDGKLVKQGGYGVANLELQVPVRNSSPATLDEAARPFRLADGKAGEFGLGWYASARNGHRVMQMTGGAAVAHLRLPDDHLSVIVLTNLQGASPTGLAMSIAQLYVPQLKAAQ